MGFSEEKSQNLIISEAEGRETFTFGEFTTTDSTFIKKTIVFHRKCIVSLM